jgi:hypothetical protein
MPDGNTPIVGRRGASLLIEHCRTVRGVGDAREPAFDRLELALGNQLARMLVSALADRRARVAELAA